VSQISIVTGLAGRFVAFLALWFLIVEIPLFARRARGNSLVAMAREKLSPFVDPAAMAATAGVLSYAWTAGFPVVIRAPFVWATATYPNVAAVAPVQVTGWKIILAMSVAAALAGLVYAHYGAHAATREDSAQSSSRFSWIWPRVALLLLIGATVTTWIDVAVIGLVLFLSPFLAQLLWRVPFYAALLQRVPTLVRFVAGYLITVYIGKRIAVGPMYSQKPSVFFSIILVVSVGVVVYDLLFGPGFSPRSNARGQHAATVARVAVASAFIILIPRIARAHDCSDPGDCYSDPFHSPPALPELRVPRARESISLPDRRRLRRIRITGTTLSLRRERSSGKSTSRTSSTRGTNRPPR
jgi:hypothetical protein